MTNTNQGIQTIPKKTKSDVHTVKAAVPTQSSEAEDPSNGTEIADIRQETDGLIPPTNVCDAAAEIVDADDSDEPGKSTDDEGPTNKLALLCHLLHRRRGLLFAIASALLFSLGNVLMDILADELNVFQISCMTNTFAIVLSGAIVGIRRLKRPRGKYQWLSVLTSGMLLALGLPTGLLSLKYMSVGASVSVIFTMPVFAGIFAWIFLKETPKLIHMFFVLLSSSGVILIGQPEFIFGRAVEQSEDENILLGTLYGLATAIIFALWIVVSRKQSIMGINVFVLMLCNSVITCTFGAGVCTILNAWSNPSAANWFELVGFASLDFAGQVLMLMAVVAEAAMLVSLGITSEVIFAFIWQILLFKDYPDWMTIVGAVLIVISCSGIAINSPDHTDPKSDQSPGEDEELTGNNECGNTVSNDLNNVSDPDSRMKNDFMVQVSDENFGETETS